MKLNSAILPLLGRLFFPLRSPLFLSSKRCSAQLDSANYAMRFIKDLSQPSKVRKLLLLALNSSMYSLSLSLGLHLLSFTFWIHCVVHYFHHVVSWTIDKTANSWTDERPNAEFFFLFFSLFFFRFFYSFASFIFYSFFFFFFFSATFTVLNSEQVRAYTLDESFFYTVRQIVHSWANYQATPNTQKYSKIIPHLFRKLCNFLPSECPCPAVTHTFFIKKALYLSL